MISDLMINAIEDLIGELKSKGVRYVFGIEGGSWVPYMESMRKNGIEFILVANEASAGIMADVCFRITGIPGVCYATYGPGATNLSTGVGCAYLDRSAVIALTSEFDEKQSGKRVQMNIDHQLLFKGITKYTFRLNNNHIGDSVDRAFRLSEAEVPGPVHIGISSENINQGRGHKPSEIEPENVIQNEFSREKLDKLEKILAGSKKPVIAAGLTASRLNLGNKLRKIADLHNIPILLTPMAKGMISHDHKWYSGVLFHAMSRELKEIYKNADLVIGIGYDPVEFCYEDWMPDVPLINIDTVPADVDDSIDLACGIAGKIDKTLDHIAGLPEIKTEWDPVEIKNVREMLQNPPSLKDGSLGPVAVLRILRENLPSDGIMTCDVGAHTHLIGQIWEVEAPGMFIMTNGWSSMGFGIPSAIAAKLFLPDRKVVCVTGDGGFLMMAGEIVTARRLGLNVVFLILADRELSLIRIKQDNRGITRYGVKLYDDDLINENTFFGVPVLTIRNEKELGPALEKGFENKGPLIIEAVINSSEYNSMITGVFK
ncbi:MAG: thiamine pyrophosphate-binding protein [Acidobacteriota bacterium]